MKFITREEMDEQPWRGRGSSTQVFRTVLAMEKGQILFIEKADWADRKYPPSNMIRYINEKYSNRKYTILRHAAQTGWAVERLK